MQGAESGAPGFLAANCLENIMSIRASQSDAGVTTELVMLEDSDLDAGDVTVRVDYSTINYKDGLAITNASPVIRHFPLIPGIDLSGTVEASDSAEFAVDDTVVLNGWGLSQTHDGGFSQKAGFRPTGSSACLPASTPARPPRSERRAIPRCSQSLPSNMVG